jgi:hypothetical protein
LKKSNSNKSKKSRQDDIHYGSWFMNKSYPLKEFDSAKVTLNKTPEPDNYKRHDSLSINDDAKLVTDHKKHFSFCRNFGASPQLGVSPQLSESISKQHDSPISIMKKLNKRNRHESFGDKVMKGRFVDPSKRKFSVDDEDMNFDEVSPNGKYTIIEQHNGRRTSSFNEDLEDVNLNLF